MKKFVVIVAILLTRTCVWGEPTPTIRWLMSEPASLFDIGMWRLRKKNLEFWSETLEKEGQFHSDRSGSSEKWSRNAADVNYDWDKNIIKIHTGLLGVIDKKICTRLLQVYKGLFGGFVVAVADLTRLPLDLRAKFLLKSYFGHQGYEKPTQPESLYANIANIIEFSVQIDQKGKQITCVSRLLGEKVLFGE